MSSKKLIEKCLAGDHRAWEEFAQQYGRLLQYAAGTRLAQWGIRLDPLQTEEVVQQILVHLWQGKKLAQVRNEKRISAWLSVVAGNFAIDWWRKQNQTLARKTLSLSESLTGEGTQEFTLEASIVAESVSPRQECQLQEEHQQLTHALLSLSLKEQMALKLAYLLEQTHQEIGNLLGMPQNTVSTLIRRAKKKLRVILEEKL